MSFSPKDYSILNCKTNRTSISYTPSSPFRFRNLSENMNARSEAITQAELERCMTLTKNILLKNRDFLEKPAAALVEKGNLLSSDIREIKRSVVVTEAPVF